MVRAGANCPDCGLRCCFGKGVGLNTVTSKAIVQVLTMGGTIAGVSESAVSASYQPGARSGAALLASVPGLANLGEIRVRDVVAKDSSDLVLEDWAALVDAVREAIFDESIKGVVITHGTDTMEETAFLLSLVVASVKPVILVGAMRPATSLSADGPLNLYNAVSVAIHPDSAQRGVQVVMNDRIMPARWVTKSHTTALEAFAMPAQGGFGAASGTVLFGKVQYFEPAPQRSQLDRALLDWPARDAIGQIKRVDILYQHVGMVVPSAQHMLDPAGPPVGGLVIAGTGAGNVAGYLKPLIESLQKNGVVVVRATRVWAGAVVSDYQQLDSEWGLVSAGALSPHKARILLMLLLQQTADLTQVRRYFDRYAC